MSIINSIMMNMYNLGFINKNEEENMAHLKTLYNEYIIEFKRKENKWKGTEISDLYFICNFSISNNLDIKLLEFNTSIIDIYSLLDNLSQLFNNDIKEVYIPIKSINLNYLSFYTFYFHKHNEDNIEFLIYENYPTVSLNRLKMKILFDEKILEDFMNIIYFIFLIDIDNNDNLDLDKIIL